MAKTVEHFIKGLEILSQAFKNSMQEAYFLGAEHDKIFIYTDEEFEFNNREIELLEEYGFKENEHGGWSYFT